jgi:hypothetical protein
LVIRLTSLLGYGSSTKAPFGYFTSSGLNIAEVHMRYPDVEQLIKRYVLFDVAGTRRWDARRYVEGILRQLFADLNG